MKGIKRGNTYRKLGWYKRNEHRIWLILCIIAGVCVALGFAINIAAYRILFAS